MAPRRPGGRADRLVCKCLVVGERQILKTIAAGARTVEQIGARCEAGTGCTSCHGALQALLDEVAAAGEPDPQLGLFGEL